MLFTIRGCVVIDLIIIMEIANGAKKRRIDMTLATKFSVVSFARKNPGIKQKDICRKFELAQSTVSGLLKKGDEIVKAFEGGRLSVEQKRASNNRLEKVDSGLLEWFGLMRSKGEVISGAILKEKAQAIASQLYADEIISDGWIQRWKKRHAIKASAISGESGSVNQSVVDEWKNNQLQKILEKYSPQDIYNVDETGLFWKAMPTRTLAFKGEKCSGGKQAKQRITVLVGGSMAGEKLPLLVIGKSAKPRCFKNKRLPTSLSYFANKKAWMVSSLFEDWLRKFDRKMKADKRKVVLIIDNCPAHPAVPGLTNVELVFLPPNTTSVSQPMDGGIIRNLKLYYRKQIV